MSKTITLKGPGLNEYFAEDLVERHGIKALEMTSGPMLEAVKRVLHRQHQDLTDRALHEDVAPRGDV